MLKIVLIIHLYFIFIWRLVCWSYYIRFLNNITIFFISEDLKARERKSLKEIKDLKKDEKLQKNHSSENTCGPSITYPKKRRIFLNTISNRYLDYFSSLHSFLFPFLFSSIIYLLTVFPANIFLLLFCSHLRIDYFLQSTFSSFVSSFHLSQLFIIFFFYQSFTLFFLLISIFTQSFS